jgi:hypothetical protein
MKEENKSQMLLEKLSFASFSFFACQSKKLRLLISAVQSWLKKARRVIYLLIKKIANRKIEILEVGIARILRLGFFLKSDKKARRVIYLFLKKLANRKIEILEVGIARILRLGFFLKSDKKARRVIYLLIKKILFILKKIRKQKFLLS